MFCTQFGCIGFDQEIPAGGLATIISVGVNIVNLLIILAIILAFFFLIWGGIKWITSAGDKQGLANAKGTITYALIGLVLAFLSLAILAFITNFFQVDLANLETKHSGVPLFRESYIPKGTFKN